MKIITRGNPRLDRLIQETCSYCKTVIEFTVREGCVTHDPQKGNYITVTCPVCNCKIYKDLKQS